jgi:hypothetical protein
MINPPHFPVHSAINQSPAELYCNKHNGVTAIVFFGDIAVVGNRREFKR